MLYQWATANIPFIMVWKNRNVLPTFWHTDHFVTVRSNFIRNFGKYIYETTIQYQTDFYISTELSLRKYCNFTWFPVWKFCGKEQFSHSFGQIAQNCAETSFPQKVHIRKLGEITVFYVVCGSWSNTWDLSIQQEKKSFILNVSQLFCEVHWVLYNVDIHISEIASIRWST